MRGYLTFRKKNSWKRYYFVIHEDSVLYYYKASEDVVALESIPLLGWKVTPCTDPIDGFDASSLFQITHTGRPTMIFKTDSHEIKEKWMKAMTDASVLS
jgi:FYVE/RhoGEF/PH domain-containing protein 5/6